MSSEVTAATSALAISDDQPKPAESSAPTPPAPAPDASPAATNTANTASAEAPETGTPAPVNTTTAESEEPSPPVQEEAPQDGPLAEFGKALTGIIAEVGYAEMWGVDLTNTRDSPTCIVLQKFLRANDNDCGRAAHQLKEALAWRKEFRPLDAVREEHSRELFEGLGYITHHTPPQNIDDAPPKIITWNIYGGAKDRQATFGNIDQFSRWRVAMMELGVQALKINEATAPIPEGGEDMYRMIQVHDYQNVSFLRFDPEIKAAGKKMVEIFSTGYPELLEHKYFVNVPYVMNWIFNFFKMFMAPQTVAKFHPMAKGTMLANELPTIGDTLPGAYGGRGPALAEDKDAIAPHLAQEAAGEMAGASAETEANEGKLEDTNIGKSAEASAEKA